MNKVCLITPKDESDEVMNDEWWEWWEWWELGESDKVMNESNSGDKVGWEWWEWSADQLKAGELSYSFLIHTSSELSKCQCATWLIVENNYTSSHVTDPGPGYATLIIAITAISRTIYLLNCISCFCLELVIWEIDPW